MKDRVSLYPGRVKLTPVAGQENVYDLVRADQPTQEGTALNKENLLKDATAALLGGDENMVPNDAFLALHDRLTVYRKLEVFDKPGAFEFAVPPGVTHILAFIVSGGRSGAARHITTMSRDSSSYRGGSSGTIDVFSDDHVTTGNVFKVVVGAGGEGVSANADGSKYGNNGGSSAFGGIVASGQLFEGELIGSNPVATCSNVQKAKMADISMTMRTFLAIALMSTIYKNENMLTNLSAGGSIMYINYSGSRITTICAQPAEILPNGKTSSAGKAVEDGDATATMGTDFGCGGGCAVARGSGYTATSAAGMSGVVEVWGY